MATVLYILLGLLTIVSLWITVQKAGGPGWSQIIPIYNLIVLLQIAGKPVWWILLILFIPIVNLIFYIMMLHGISTCFGKSAVFTVGLFFLPFVFFPILAFGEAKYTKPK